MRFILDTHPEIACAPETKLMGGLYEFSRYPQLRLALATLGVTREQGSVELAQFVHSIMGKYAARAGKRRWADKTPNYYRILPFIREVFDGEALFLFPARHPFDTLTSLVEFFDQRVGVEADPETDRISRSYGAGPRRSPQFLISSAKKCRPTCSTRYSPRRITWAWRITRSAGTGTIHDRSTLRWTGWKPEQIAATWRLVAPLARTLGYTPDPTAPVD